MVDANGKIITASQSQHKDLFWANCGAGGGNFGALLLLLVLLPQLLSGSGVLAASAAAHHLCCSIPLWLAVGLCVRGVAPCTDIKFECAAQAL